MLCSTNAFCSTLPAQTREKLCKVCRFSMFAKGTIQSRGDYGRSCQLVLDGALSNSTDLGIGQLDHRTEVPMTYLGLPGRVLNLDITFGFSTFKDALGYSNYEYLRDTWVAEFPHKAVYEFFDSDREFRQALSRNMLLIETDMCRYTALFRPNYTYLGLYHLLKMLADNDQYISQQSIASLMNLDRTSITKAMSRLKKEEPEVWERYQANKSRKVSRPIQP